jgi:signal transduction histidine kinase
MFRQNLDRLGKSEVELKLNWDWPSETLRLKTDPFRIKQVLSNLMGNAIKFTDKGVIELGVKQIDGFVRLSVKDSGIGISEEKQVIIFDRFMQGHVTKDRLYGGTGLGLAISKNLVDLLGGDIGVVSVPGVGSEFWFTIPCDEKV